jgi:hypothetical protein
MLVAPDSVKGPGRTLKAEPAGVAYGRKAGCWVLLVAVLGSGMAFLDVTVVNVALPSIGARRANTRAKVGAQRRSARTS